jgi:hypothetical protein
LYVVNTDRSGGGNEGSANAPTPTPISCGMRSGSQNTVDPHSEQNWKITSFSELRSEGLRSAIDNRYRATLENAAMLNKLPVRRWQTMAHRNAQVLLGN